MVVLNNLKAEIRVDGIALPEYDDHKRLPHPPNEVSKYVEAPTGKKFGIHVIIPKHYGTTSDRLGLDFSIDGHLDHGTSFEKEADEEHEIIFDELYVGHGRGSMKIRRFLFREIDFGEIPRSSLSTDSMTDEVFRNLGTIKITVYRLNNIEDYDSTEYVDYTDDYDAGPRRLKHRLGSPGITQSVVEGIVEKMFRLELQAYYSEYRSDPHTNSSPNDPTMKRIQSRHTSLSPGVSSMKISRKEPPEPVSKDSSPSRDHSQPVSRHSSPSVGPSISRPKREPLYKPFPNLRSTGSPSPSSSKQPSNLRSPASPNPPEPVPRRHQQRRFEPYNTRSQRSSPSVEAPEPVPKRSTTSKLAAGSTSSEEDDEDAETEDEG
ncbi:MAG: hypothetical protein Q9221_001924 [Calogaya cf. arnoldii]